MSWASERYQDYLSENSDDSCQRPHLKDHGYEWEEGGYWVCDFVNKVVVARKDHPKFGIKKGQRHRYIKTKCICDETGASSWEVQRISLQGKSPEQPPMISWNAPTAWSTSTSSSWGTKTWFKK